MAELNLFQRLRTHGSGILSARPESLLEPDTIRDDSTKLGKFNKKFLENFQRECTKAVERDAGGDLEPLLEKYRSRYSRFREARKNRESQHALDSSSE
jgi:hypothetical protein